jgi:chromosomal replication initiation ATPase DnaA
MTTHEILESVANETEVSIEEIKGGSRKQRIVHARWRAIQELKRHKVHWSNGDIADALGLSCPGDATSDAAKRAGGPAKAGCW